MILQLSFKKLTKAWRDHAPPQSQPFRHSRSSSLAGHLEGDLSELSPLLGDEVAMLLLVPLENLLGDLSPVGLSGGLGGLEVLGVLLDSLDELGDLGHVLLAVCLPGL